MDDLSVCICATSNQALLAKTGIALSILIDLCQAAHMHPNLKKGKTEVMFHFQVCGSRGLRRRFYSETCEFPVVCENATHHISVVSRYLHLGGILHRRTVTCAEITRRLGIAQQAFTQHRRILYRHSQIAWKKRQEMFSTLVLSKLMYGFESWTFDTQKSRDQLHAGIIKLYKRLLGSNHAAQVIVSAGLPSPTELLRGCRLRYFGTLYRCGRAAHWGLLCEDTAWIAMLEDDLLWLWQQLQNNTNLLLALMRNRRQYLGACTAKRFMHRKLGKARTCLKGTGFVWFRASARQLFEDTSCPNCLREYHTRAKVLAHLRHAHQCRQSLLGRRLKCDPTSGTGSSIDRALHERTDGAIPFLQGYGPKPPDGALVDFIDYDMWSFLKLFTSV